MKNTTSGSLTRKPAFAMLLLAHVGFAATLPLVFEKNQGQTDARVRYLAHSSQSTLWLTDQEVVVGSAQGSLRIRFEGGNREPVMEPEEALPGKTNYFMGNQPSRWQKDIPLFGKVRYRAIYPGIDAVFYGNPQDLEYDLVLAPGADPRKIRLVYGGVKRMRIDSTGDLVLTVGSSEIRQHRPRIYQGTQEIAGGYAVLGRNRVGFYVAAYDRRKALTIDPVMTYATFLGGSLTDTGSAVAMDAQGNLYLTGIAGSSDFPIVGGLNQPGPRSTGTTAFVAKINPAASGAASLVWSTFLGSPTNGTTGGSVAVDAGGNVYAGGITLSTDFPVVNAFQPAANCAIPGTSNCVTGYISKISPGGNQLLYSSYLGGGTVDGVLAIAVDGAGSAYVAGVTQSPGFPVRGAAFQGAIKGHLNGTLSKVSPDGSALLYSTFFGGEGSDFILAIALDSRGIVYLGGHTTSTALPVTQNPYQGALTGSVAGFVAKFDITQANAAGLLYGSYIEGPSNAITSVNAVAADSSGSIVAAGSTTDPNFPVSAGAFQSKFGGFAAGDPAGATGDAFVLKLNPAAPSQLVYSTFLGGAGNDSAAAVAVDNAGRIAIAGVTASSNLPTTADAFECCFSNPGNIQGNASSGFFARIDPAKSGASSLLYSTYLGGSSGGIANMTSLALNSAGTVAAVAGSARSTNIPVTSSAFQKQIGSNGAATNTYVARFDLTAAGPVTAVAVNGASFMSTGLSPGLIFTLAGTGLGPAAGAGPQIDANGRVATLLAGTQVLVDGMAAPLLYVSATQINAVAPYALAAKNGKTVFVQVITSGIPGSVFPVTVTDTAPGIFYSVGGQGAILNQDQSINGANNPALKGSYVSIFMTGEGQTNPVVPDGHLAFEPVDKLARPVAPVSVSIGGIAVPAADIYYAGAAPQNVAGLLQVTVKVPANAASGNVPVAVTIGNKNSQSGVTVALK
ncbi:MAG: hypothetical protein M3O35_21205 [Acidobacteriota bacterium]|nr:hypothetical protein [Acidobacteriota bacterium]